MDRAAAPGTVMKIASVISVVYILISDISTVNIRMQATIGSKNTGASSGECFGAFSILASVSEENGARNVAFASFAAHNPLIMISCGIFDAASTEWPPPATSEGRRHRLIRTLVEC